MYNQVKYSFCVLDLLFVFPAISVMSRGSFCAMSCFLTWCGTQAAPQPLFALQLSAVCWPYCTEGASHLDRCVHTETPHPYRSFLHFHPCSVTQTHWNQTSDVGSVQMNVHLIINLQVHFLLSLKQKIG